MADSWLIDGNCENCRRKNYCQKPCTKATRKKEAFIQNAVHNVVSKHLGLDMFYDHMRRDGGKTFE